MSKSLVGAFYEQYIDNIGDALPMYELRNYNNKTWRRVMDYKVNRFAL